MTTCQGCACGVPVRDGMHEEDGGIPGKVYAYPCTASQDAGGGAMSGGTCRLCRGLLVEDPASPGRLMCASCAPPDHPRPEAWTDLQSELDNERSTREALDRKIARLKVFASGWRLAAERREAVFRAGYGHPCLCEAGRIRVGDGRTWRYESCPFCHHERRVRTLEARLARVLHLVEGSSLRVYWTDHNGGGPVWHYHRMPHDPPRRGRVWSRRHARKEKP